MKSDRARIIVFAGEAGVLAELATAGRRMSEIVNDPGSDHIEVEEARFIRGEPPESVASTATGLLRKSAADAIIVLREPAASAERRLASYVAKSPKRVAILLPEMAITGTVHVQQRQDPVRLVLDGPERFAVLTEAKVVPVRGSSRVAPVVLVNRSRLVAAGLVE
jgi:hypothetical protein